MGYGSRAFLAGGLGFAVSFVVACGGGNGLLSGNQAADLSNELNPLPSAVASFQCSGAQAAARSFSNSVANLPSTVNTTLAQNLAQGATTVSQPPPRGCPSPRTPNHNAPSPAVPPPRQREPAPAAARPRAPRRAPPRRRRAPQQPPAPARLQPRRPVRVLLPRPRPGGPGWAQAPATAETDDGRHDDDRRALPDRGPARRRRDVDRPSGLRQPPGALRGDQVAGRAPGRRSDIRVAVPARGAVSGPAGASEHRPGVRLRLRRGPPPALHRDGARIGQLVRRAAARPGALGHP